MCFDIEPLAYRRGDWCQQVFMKLFKTNNIDVVKSCQLYFGFSLPSEEWVKQAKNLDAKYIACERAFVYYGSSMFY